MDDSLLSDITSSTGRTRYYKSQIAPHAGDPDYKLSKARTIFLGVVCPSYGLARADDYEYIIRKIMGKIRFKKPNRDVIGVYVPSNKKAGQPDPVAYFVITSKSPIHFSAVLNSIKGVGKAVKITPGKRDKADAYLEAALSFARASYPGHDHEFGPFKEGRFPEPKKPGRKPKPKYDVPTISDVEAAPSPAMKNIVAYEQSDRKE